MQIFMYVCMSVCMYVCTYVYIYIYTGRTNFALVELLTVNMFGFIFFCAPFPHRILAWSFVVPRSNFHPPKAFNLIDLKAGDN